MSEAFDDYLNCGILYHGWALTCCTECSHSELIAFSCKRRGLCSSCDAKRAVIFAEQLYSTLLELPHCHVVFTIPKRLRVFFKYNRKLTKHLYTAAWLSWKELAIMKIKSFITPPSEIKRLCDYHKLPAWRAPPIFKIKTAIQICFSEFY